METLKFDLTNYSTKASSTVPYHKVIKTDDYYYFYEGAIGQNRFQYFKVLAASKAIGKYDAFHDKYEENVYRVEFYEDWKKVLNLVEIDALEKLVGEEAYLKYWDDCIPENLRKQINFHSILHFRALQEWYFIKFKCFEQANKVHWLNEEVKVAAMRKWNEDLLHEVGSYLKLMERKPGVVLTGISSFHANELFKFFLWIEQQKNVASKPKDIDMTQASYVELMLDGYFHHTHYLADYFFREFKRAEEKYILPSEFFKRLLEANVYLRKEIEAIYGERLYRFYLAKDQMQAEQKWKEEYETSKPEMWQCSVNLFSVTNCKFRGHLFLTDLKVINEAITNALEKYQATLEFKTEDNFKPTKRQESHSKKRVIENKDLNLEEIFVTSTAYREIITLLVKENLIDEDSHKWIETSKGFQSKVAALLFHLFHNRYYSSQFVTLPSPETIKALALNSFGVSIGIRTIKDSYRINNIRKEFSFIKRYNNN